jgi:hypothetical protein
MLGLNMSSNSWPSLEWSKSRSVCQLVDRYASELNSQLEKHVEPIQTAQLVIQSFAWAAEFEWVVPGWSSLLLQKFETSQQFWDVLVCELHPCSSFQLCSSGSKRQRCLRFMMYEDKPHNETARLGQSNFWTPKQMNFAIGTQDEKPRSETI